MCTHRVLGWMASLIGLFALAPCAHAQWAVVDVGAIGELIQQVETTREQLSTARDHLTQARHEFDSITGSRGMERLLSGVARNYLPSQWSELSAVLEQTSSTYGQLSGEMQRLVASNAVLTPAALARLSSEDRALVDSSRRSGAMLQTLTRQALDRTGSRFDAIQQLIDAIPRATDQKGVLDLQARIEAEQTMLQNENTKLQVLFQLAQAEDAVRAQRAREQAINAFGSLRDLKPMGLMR